MCALVPLHAVARSSSVGLWTSSLLQLWSKRPNATSCPAAAAAIAAGIPASSIAIDPGFGFGKTVTHNLQLVNWLSLFHGLGVVVLFGASRKSSIAKISAGEPAEARLAGSLALAAAAWRQGAQIIRVHDVAETAQALAVEAALRATDS